MAYGSKPFQPRPFPRHRIVALTKKKPSNSQTSENTGLYRILITLGEIALTMIAGAVLGPKGAIAAQVGIGLLGATGHTALSVRNNSLTGIGVAVDYLTAFIPIGTGLNNARRVKKALTSSDFLTLRKQLLATKTPQSSLLKALDDKMVRGKQIYEEALNHAAAVASKNGIKQKAVYKKLVKNFGFPADSLTEKAAWDKVGLLKKNIEKSMQEYYDLLDKNIITHYIASVGEGLQRQAVLLKGKAFQNLENLQAAFRKIEALPWYKRLSKPQFKYEALKLTPTTDQKVVSRFLDDVLLSKGARRVKAAVAVAKLKIRIINKALTKPGQKKFNLFLNRFKTVATSRKAMAEALDTFVKTLSQRDFDALSKVLDGKDLISYVGIYGAGGIWGNPIEGNTVRRWVKAMGTQRFNARFVQLAQLSDPNDVGRYGPELLYQWARRKWQKALYNRAFLNATRAGARNIRKSKSLAQAFKKSGGVLMRAQNRGNNVTLYSRYIVGIKMLPGGTPQRRWVLVKFNKANTGGLTGKNVGGKKDIVVAMSDYDFEQLATSGTQYWFQQGLKKRWFISRGGRAVLNSRHVRVLSNSMSLFLGFVPIQPLRYVLSLVSNWVESASDVAEGDYFSTWWARFSRAFIRSSINRSARFFAKVVVGASVQGYAAGKAQMKATRRALQMGLARPSKEFKELVNAAVTKASRKSAWVGRELQRASITVLSAHQTVSRDGYFEWRRRSAGQLGLRFAKQAVPTSFRSAAIRKERYSVMGRRRKDFTFAYGRQLVNTKRYLKHVTRVYSAVTPNRNVPTLRALTRMRR